MCENFGVLDTTQAVESRMSWRRLWVETDKIQKEIVAAVEFWVDERWGNIGWAVVKSRVFLIIRRSRIDEKQDFDTEEIWWDIERVESKITPSFRGELAGMMATLEGMSKVGSASIQSWADRSMRRNSVLAWFSERKFEDIQLEARSIVACKCRLLAKKSEAEKEMNSWVSSA
jgi:hypothetical protein